MSYWSTNNHQVNIVECSMKIVYEIHWICDLICIAHVPSVCTHNMRTHGSTSFCTIITLMSFFSVSKSNTHFYMYLVVAFFSYPRHFIEELAIGGSSNKGLKPVILHFSIGYFKSHRWIHSTIYACRNLSVCQRNKNQNKTKQIKYNG